MLTRSVTPVFGMKLNLKLLLIGTALSLSACSSMGVPDVLPEFRDAASGSESFEYPNPAEAPAEPQDLRSAEEWDSAATDILAKQESFEIPDDTAEPLTDAQIKRQFNALKSKVKEYKLDDPVEE